MLEAVEFIYNGMYVIDLFNLIIYVYNRWPSLYHLTVVINFLLSVVVYNPFPTCREQSVANYAK